MEISVGSLRYLGFKLNVPTIGEVELAWNAETKVLAIEGVKDASAALVVAECIVGQRIHLVAGEGSRAPVPAAPQQAAPGPVAQPQQAPAAQPQQPQLALVQPPAAQQPQAQPTPGTPTGLQQPVNQALPEDAVFARMATLQEVTDELVKQGAKTEAEVLAAARALLARRVCPKLNGIDEEDFDERVSMSSMGSLVAAGIG